MKHILTVFFTTLSALYALPEQPSIRSGDVNIRSQQKYCSVESSSERAIIHWQEFSLAKGESLSFNLPQSSSALLNKVVGEMPSKINGSITSNGHIYLINPNGILIGKSGMIHTASFLASTMHLSDKDFLDPAKEWLFKEAGGGGSIKNEGWIYANEGSIYLFGKTIENNGVLQSPLGKIGIGASHQILFQPKKEKFSIFAGQTTAPLREGVKGDGSMEGQEINLQVDGNLFELAINLSGYVQASGINKEEGKIELVADNGKIKIDNGYFSAGKNGGMGGEIYLIGKELILDGKTLLSSSQNRGGGTIYLGGEMGGKASIFPNSDKLFIGEKVRVDASAKQEGNGGEISLFAKRETLFEGELFARGGAISGDGGKIEVSGLQNLVFKGRANTLAPRGKGGELLIDPNNIEINSGASTIGGACPVFGGGAGTVNMDVDDINSCLSSNAVVTVTTTPGTGGVGNIEVDADVVVSSSGNRLILNADNDIIFSNDLTFNGVAQTGELDLFAGRNVQIDAGDDLIVNDAATLRMYAGLLDSSGSINIEGDLLVTDTLQSELSTLGREGDIIVDDSGTATFLGSSVSSDVSFFAGRDFLILDQCTNTGTGSFTAVTGRDFRVGGLTDDARFGVRLGDVTIQAGRDLIVRAGTGSTDEAILGMDVAGLPTVSNITMTVVRDVLVEASSPGGSAPAIIGHGKEDVDGLDKTGNITFTAVGGNITLTGGSGGDSWAQIGHIRAMPGSGTPITITGNIQGSGPNNVIDIPGNLEIRAGTGTQSYAMLGHGGRIESLSTTISGNVGVRANEITITGASSGNADNAACLGYYVAVSGGANSVTINGGSAVRAISSNNITLQSNEQSAILGARVRGTGGALGDIDLTLVQVDAGLNLNLLGSVPHDSADQTFCGVFTTNGTALCNLDVDVGRTLLMNNGFGGGNTDTFTLLTNGSTPTSGRMATINVAEDAILIAGNGEAEIDVVDALHLNVGGDLVLTASSEASASVLAQNTLATSVGEALTMTSLSSTFQALIQNVDGTMNLSAAEIFMENPGADIRTTGSGNTTVITANGNLNMLEGASITSNGILTVRSEGGIDLSSGTNSGTNITGSGTLTNITAAGEIEVVGPSASQIAANTGDLRVTALGGLEVNDGSSVQNLGGSNGELHISARSILLQNASFIRNFGTGFTNISSSGDIDIFSSSSITGFGSTTITAGGDLFLRAIFLGGATVRSFNDLTIQVGNDIILRGPRTALIENADGDALLIAGNDITVDSGTTILNSGNGSLTLVVDNQAPFFGQAGSGSFTLGETGTVGRVGGGALRIFTAIRSQNDIDGTLNINGTTFVPGPFGVDSATEIYSTYYPSSLGGSPFTIFYKEPLSHLSALFVAAGFELFYRLDRYYPYEPWIWLNGIFSSNQERKKATLRYPLDTGKSSDNQWLDRRAKYIYLK